MLQKSAFINSSLGFGAKDLFRLSYVLVLTRNRTVCGFFIIVSLNCGICSSCWGLSPNKRQLQALLASPRGDSEYNAFCPYCVPLHSITTSLVIPSATVSPKTRCLLTWMLKKAFPAISKDFLFTCAWRHRGRKCVQMIDTLFGFFYAFSPASFSSEFKMESFVAFKISSACRLGGRLCLREWATGPRDSAFWLQTQWRLIPYGEKSGICQAVETKEVRVPLSDAVLVKGSQFRSHNSKFTLKLY